MPIRRGLVPLSILEICIIHEGKKPPAERDAAVACIEKIDVMFGDAYPNEILEVLDEWRGQHGAGEGENHE